MALPHMLQRCYAASSNHALKCGFWCMTMGHWILMSAGILMGVIAVNVLGAEETSIFSPIMEQIMDMNAFGYIVGLVIFTGTLAAIMSTADSLLIAISQVTHLSEVETAAILY